MQFEILKFVLPFCEGPECELIRMQLRVHLNLDSADSLNRFGMLVSRI